MTEGFINFCILLIIDIFIVKIEMKIYFKAERILLLYI